MWKYLLFLVAFHTLGRLPIPVLYALMGVVGNVAYCVASRARRNVIANLRHVLPPGTPEGELRQTARRIFRNVALYYADTGHMPWMDVQEFFQRRLVVYGIEEVLRPAIREGKGVVILSGHYGNPELAAQGLIPLGVKVVALTEPVKPPALSRLVDRFRASKGHTFGSVCVKNVKLVMQTLRRGGVVALMGDRDIEGPRQLLPFCGQEAWMPTGPVEVALRTRSPIIPCFCRRTGKYGMEAFMEEPLQFERSGDIGEDARRGALAFLQRLEARLRKDPGQWMVLESIWDAPERTPAAPALVGEKG